jgi:AcrR family transcriptional regulator
MVRAAAQLIRRQGVSATGMREIVAKADAPRGSLQHYFPGGKQELVSEALAWMGEVAARRVRRHVDRLHPRRPSKLLAAMVEEWKTDLATEDFAAGCPMLAAAADTAASSDELRRVVGHAFGVWEKPLYDALASFGIPPKRAARLGMLVISALEGAIILARLRHDLVPLDGLVEELGPLLDGAARKRRRSPARA